MTDLQKQIIERLYNAKAITFEEAMELSSKCDKENDEQEIKYLLPFKENEEEQPLTFDELVDYYYNEILDDFRVEQCVNFMHACNWNWAFELVNETTFKAHMRSMVEDTLRDMLDYIKTSRKSEVELSNDEKEFIRSCGGFEIVGYFSEVDGTPELELKFIADTGFSSSCFSSKEIIKLANSR